MQTPPEATPTTTPPSEAPTTDPSLVSEPAKPAAVPEFTPLTREDFKLEGEVADDILSEFLTTANELKLPKETAEKLVALNQRLTTAGAERIAAQWLQTQSEWQQATRTEFGERLDTSLANVKQLINEYGSKEVFEVMDLTGAGNHPAIIKLLSAVADKLVKEAGPIQGAPSSAPQSVADILFPTMRK